MVEVHRINTDFDHHEDAYVTIIPKISFENIETKVYYYDWSGYPNNSFGQVTGLHTISVSNGVVTAYINSSGTDVSPSSGLWLFYR